MAAKNSSLEKTKTPGVYRRGKKYVYAYRVRGVQRWKTVDTYDEARRGKLAAEVDVDRGELRDLSRVSFGDYAREWIVNYQGRTSNGFRGSTRRAYTQMLEARNIPYFDGRVRLRLAEIEPRDVKAFVRWMNEQEDPRRPGRLLGKSWIRQHIAVLRALLGDAMEEGVIRHNPAAGVRVTVPEGDGTNRPRAIEKRAMTIDELRRVVAEVPPRWQLLCEFMAHTGLRIGEVSELRWGRDVILTGRPYVKLRWQFADNRVCEPKTRYGKRDIPLSPGLVASSTRSSRPTPTATSSSPPHAERASTATTCSRRSLAPRRGAQACRGSRCTPSGTPAPHSSSPPVEHGGGGKNAKQVQEWLGHHSPAYTLKEYVHLIDAGVGDASFFDAVLGS